MTVTTFVVLCLDGGEDDWNRVVAGTRATLTARPDCRLHAAANAGRLSDVRIAIENGWPLEEFDGDLRRTPVHAAATSGHVDTVKALVDAGVDVDRHDESCCQTPLSRVADSCSLEMARVLVEAGADPTIPDDFGMNAIERAASRSDEQGHAVTGFLRANALGK